jgi:U3 small nucleolar RNA-associated protein 12
MEFTLSAMYQVPSIWLCLVCAIFAGNKYVIVGTKTGELEIYDLGSSSLVEIYPKAHDGPIWSIETSPDNCGLTSGFLDKEVTGF